MTTYLATTEVIACSLSTDDLAETEGAWHDLFQRSLVSSDAVPGGLRLVFRPESANALPRLIDVERECCPWVTFDVDEAVVTMTAGGEGESAIRAMWGPQPAPSGSR